MRVVFNQSGWGAVVTFIEGVWWFVIARYVVKDIEKLIEQIKNGQVSTTDTNIKADML